MVRSLTESFATDDVKQELTLKRHMMAQYPKDHPHSCPHCEYSAVICGDLKKHMNAKHYEDRPYAWPYRDLSSFGAPMIPDKYIFPACGAADSSNLILEEEESSEIINDCNGDENQVHVVFDDYRQLGLNIHTDKEEYCLKGNKILFNGFHEIPDEWTPSLDCVKPLKVTSDRIIDELKDSLASSGTYIKKSLFDSTVLLDSGQTLVEKYTLCNSWIEVDIIDFGATVTAVRVYDGYQWTDVVLGFDNVADYINSKNYSMGGTIGRVASTIENGKFKLINEQGLQDVQLSKNENGHHSNGGFYPLQRRIWTTERCDDRLVMSCKSSDNEEGYPGNLTVWAVFSLTGDCALNIEYFALSDTITPVNITNGICFNLAGHDSGAESLYDHSIFINAELCCLPEEESDGKMGLVYKTSYDLTDPKHLGCVMEEVGGPGLDVTFALYRSKPEKKNPTELSVNGSMIIGAVARHEESGRTLVMSTDQWGLRLHTCNHNKPVRGKGKGVEYFKHSGFSLQSGSLPNAVNIEHFPSIFITPYEPYRHLIRYYFTTVKQDLSIDRLYPNMRPWLKEEIILKCDSPMEEAPAEENKDLEGLYRKTFTALEKLAEQKCSDNYEDDDSLSLHSSFTSFGSKSETLIQEPCKETESEYQKDVETQEKEQKTEDEINSTYIVKELFPLPPFVTGKWPRRAVKKKEDIPVPSKKVCPKSTDSKPNEIKTVTKNEKKYDDCKKSPGKYKIEPQSYNKMKVGVVERVNEVKKKEKENGPTSKTPKGLKLCEPSSGFLDIKNPVIEEIPDKLFQWFEPPELLPWNCGMSKSQKDLKSFLPDDDRRKQMGTLFKLINFPEEYSDFEGTTTELHNAIKLKIECLKGLYNSMTTKATKERF